MDPAAWSVAIIAIIAALTTGIISVITALRTSAKATDIKQTLEKSVETQEQIHKAVNTNYQEMQAQLEKAKQDLKDSMVTQLDAALARIVAMQLESTKAQQVSSETPH